MSQPGSFAHHAAACSALEMAWLPAEAAGFWAVRPILRRLGAGDQHPVLLLPGFGTDDTAAGAAPAGSRPANRHERRSAAA